MDHAYQLYLRDMEFSGPYDACGKKLFFVSFDNECYIFHRETAYWIRIDRPVQGTNLQEFVDHNTELISNLLEAKDSESPEQFSEIYDPNCIMLFPTESCNLRCVYCHCNSSIGKHMDPELAHASILGYIDKYASTRAHLAIMGGGEPTVNMPLVMDSVKYFRSICDSREIKSTTSIVTNGCCDFQAAEFIFDNFDKIRVSFDGLPTIQDAQRPRSDGKPSWPMVSRFFKQAEACGRKVSIRATLAFEQSSRISEIIQFSKSLPVSMLSIEAAYKTGRAKAMNFGGTEDYGTFFGEIVKHIGQVRNSWITPFAKNDTSCRAPRGNMIVTSQGNISVCTEISENNDDISEYGIVGKVTRECFCIDAKRFSDFQNGVKSLLTKCNDCIVRYKCGGGCFAKWWRGYETDDPNLCHAVRKANVAILLHMWRQKSGLIGRTTTVS